MTIGTETFKAPDPFPRHMRPSHPIESEGTHPLPEAQVDRFMFKVRVGYPRPPRSSSSSSACSAPVMRPRRSPTPTGCASCRRPPIPSMSIRDHSVCRDPHQRDSAILASWAGPTPAVHHLRRKPRASINMVVAGVPSPTSAAGTQARPEDVRDLASTSRATAWFLSHEVPR